MLGTDTKSLVANTPYKVSKELIRESDDILESIRSKLMSMVGSSTNYTRKLKEVFIDIDRNGNNKIDRKELREALSRFRIELRMSEIDLLFERFDRNGDGNMDYKEFLDLLGNSKPSPESKR